MTDLQPIFDRIYLGLAAQSFEQSIDYNGGCVFRGINGRRCAVGHLIDEYHPGLEGHNPTQLICMLGYTGQALLMIEKCRRIHDTRRDPLYMRRALEFVAAHYNLEVPAHD